MCNWEEHFSTLPIIVGSFFLVLFFFFTSAELHKGSFLKASYSVSPGSMGINFLNFVTVKSNRIADSIVLIPELVLEVNK